MSLLLLLACTSSFYLTEHEVVDAVHTATADELILADATGRTVERLDAVTGVLDGQVYLGASPWRMAWSDDRQQLAVVYNETGDARVDLVDLDAETYTSVALGSSHGLDVAWGEGSTLYVLTQRGNSLLNDLAVVDADLGYPVQVWPIEENDFHSTLAWRDTGHLFINQRRYRAAGSDEGYLELELEVDGAFIGVGHREALAPDGAGFLFEGDDDVIVEHDADTGAPHRTYARAGDGWIADYTYTADGEWVVVLSVETEGYRVSVFDRYTGFLEQSGSLRLPQEYPVDNLRQHFLVSEGTGAWVGVYLVEGTTGVLSRYAL